MKTLAIYFTNKRKNGYPFDTRQYRQAYFDLARALAKKDIRVVIVRGPASYLGRGQFAGGHMFGAREDVLTPVPVFTADAIFDRGYGASIFDRERDARVLNAPTLDRICTDKWRTYCTFRDVSPATLFLTSAADAARLTYTFGEVTIISKPLDGQDCRDIFVGMPTVFIRRARQMRYPRIAQRFLDFSRGMPGVCRVRHDLRLLVADGVIVHSDVRLICDADELIANAASAHVVRRRVPLIRLPPAVRMLARRVDRKLKTYRPRLYAIDVGWDAVTDQPYIIELNARVGLPQPEYSWYQPMLAAFVDFLTRATRVGVRRLSRLP